MEHDVNFKMPSQAEINGAVDQARRMRSEYLVQSIRAGVSKLRAALMHKTPVNNSAA